MQSLISTDSVKSIRSQGLRTAMAAILAKHLIRPSFSNIVPEVSPHLSLQDVADDMIGAFQQLMIIDRPCSPTPPVPLVDRDPATLTAEEKHQLLRDLLVSWDLTSVRQH
jgi:hypothetical protein